MAQSLMFPAAAIAWGIAQVGFVKDNRGTSFAIGL
jgi:hypothetical protein